MGGFPVDHLIEDHSHRPHVTFGGIGVPVQNLGAHVHRTPNQGLVNLVQFGPFLVELGEPEVGQLVNLVLD